MFFKLTSILVLLCALIAFSCEQRGEISAIDNESDSLSIQIKKFIEEKQRNLALKREFEGSRYNKSVLKYRPIIRKYAKRYGFDWRLIVAQIMQESKFRHTAQSRVGARGLMQLMPRTAQEITREFDVHEYDVQYIFKNPRENIAAGIYHLKKQFNYFPNADLINRTKLSLASYNCGAGRVFDAQTIARFYNHPPNNWNHIRDYLAALKKSDWEIHLQVWPLGRPKYGYFYGNEETVNYVERIWELFQIYKKIL
jgi:membrane-bound lytic murein transglycosylase F